MAKPLLYPEWATTDTTLPATGNTNKQRPKESLRNIGWDKGQVPTAEEWNWQFDNISDWIVWFNENNLTTKTFTLTGDVVGTVNYTNEGGFSVTTEVEDNSHNHISDNILDATSSATANKVSKRDSNGSIEYSRVFLADGVVTAPSLVFGADIAQDTGFYHPSDGVLGVTVNQTAIGSFQPDGLHMSLKGNADTASSVNSITNNISILTGIIAHGGTIPLPSGYSEGQCHWTVSTAGIKDFGGDDVFLTHHCFTTGRVVSCYTDGTFSATGNANYTIIGFK